MREVEMAIYKVNELSEQAKRKAYYSWLEGAGYGWAEENRATLTAFEDIFPVAVTSWEYDDTSGHARIVFEDDADIAELSGIRLLKYLFNNYWNHITTGRYYSTSSRWVDGKYHSKSRNSKVLLTTPSTGACPLTGYYMDEEILRPVFDFMNKPSAGTTFEALMEECMDAWVRACVDDFAACTSMEYFEEEAAANDFEFHVDGCRY